MRQVNLDFEKHHNGSRPVMTCALEICLKHVFAIGLLGLAGHLFGCSSMQEHLHALSAPSSSSTLQLEEAQSAWTLQQ